MHKPPPIPADKHKSAEIKVPTKVPTKTAAKTAANTWAESQQPDILASLDAAMNKPAARHLPMWSQPALPMPALEDTRGKSRNPDYVRIGVVLHKDTKKFASRLWEDMEPKKDLSDLVEVLLQRFIAEHQRKQG